MHSISVNTEEMEWMPGTPFYGPGAVFEGKAVVHLKILSDRRSAGGGIAWLVRITPPPGQGDPHHRRGTVGRAYLRVARRPWHQGG